jgi:hypothetical protein
MILEATLVDELLSRDIASREKNSGGDALGEKGTSSQLGIVPVDVSQES